MDQITEKQEKSDSLLISNVQPNIVQLTTQFNNLRNSFSSLKESTIGSFKEAAKEVRVALYFVSKSCFY